MHNYYTDYFYSINLEPGSINPRTGLFTSCETLSSFIHEYIHFLQNVLTLNGLNFTENELVLHKKFLEKKRIRLLPFSLFYINSLCNNAYKINTMFKVRDEDSFDFSSVQEIIPYKSDLFGNPEYIYEILVSYKEKKGNRYKTKFKSVELKISHILESMAFCAEKLINPNNTLTSSKNPYQIVNELTKNLCPNITNNYFVQFVLCEAALNVTNSIDFLINSLIRINDEQLCISDPLLLGTQLLAGVKIEICKENGEKMPLPINDVYSKSIDKLLETYASFFNANFPELYEWIENIFINSEYLRTNITQFPISFFIFKAAQNVQYLNCFLFDFGTPYIESDIFYSFPQRYGKDSLLLLKCYQNIIGLLITRKRKEFPCPNLNCCQNKTIICYHFPVLNRLRKELCPYASIAQNFGIPFFL